MTFLSAQVVLYCHSLDVGLAKVHHLMEAQDVNGLAVRVSSAWPFDGGPGRKQVQKVVPLGTDGIYMF